MASAGESEGRVGFSRTEVVLVGRELDDNENLGLGYLGAALGGLAAVERVVLNRATELEAAADAVLARRPALVGLSVPDGGSAHLPLALGELLRRRGYAGHITAGGPFATLARQWLLGRYAWLSSVVRFAGEQPLRELVTALREGREPGQVPGVTTRAGDGPPAPVASELPMAIRPLRGPHPRLLGGGVAHLAATRGCVGRCAYCGPAALQRLEVEEGQRAGLGAEVLRERGVGGVRRRSVEAVCDEIAALCADGVRYIYFVDEHLLPPDEAAALAYLDALGRGLAKRSVGPVGFGCMLRAELLTERMVDAFVAVGLVRAFIGVELATPAEGRRYRRRVDPDHARSILARLGAAGVATVTNLMLVHPDATAGTIAAALDLMASFDTGTVEATRMQIYHGTRLASELARAGRLTGNPLRYGYRLQDQTAERFTEILVHLRLEAFGDHSVGAMAHALELAVALGARLLPGRVPARVRDSSRALAAEVRALYVGAHREALALAADPAASARDVRELVRRSAVASRALSKRIDGDTRALAAAFAAPSAAFAPLRAAASTSLAFVLLASAACGGRATQDPETGTGAAGGAPATGGGLTGGVATGGVATGGTSCDPYLGALATAIHADVPCFTGEAWYSSPPNPVSTYFSTETIWGDCAGGALVLDAIRSDAAAAAAGVPPPAIGTCENATVHVEGSMNLEAIETAAFDCGWDGYASDFVVVVGADGVVVDVVANGDSFIGEEGLACIRTTLAGLVFPCFANGRICPQEMIFE